MPLKLTLPKVAKEMEPFIHEYPGRGNTTDGQKNYLFYCNKIPCLPDNRLIDQIHRDWHGISEEDDGYMEWLFPIRERGENPDAQSLQLHEIKRMKNNPTVQERIIKSYKLMLDFFGMHLSDETTGLLSRSSNYKDGYEKLKTNADNHQRITRILKSLSEFKLEKRFTAGFILFVLYEQSGHGELYSEEICDSMVKYWLHCIRKKELKIWVWHIMYQVIKKQRSFSRVEYVDAVSQKTVTTLC